MSGPPNRSRTVFDAALEFDGARRANFVRRACDGDAKLHAEVVRLLQAHDCLGDFLDMSRVWTGSQEDPRRIGPYEIIRKLGEGGLGRVYLAEPGPVAIKVVRRDVDPEVVIRRFRREREMLARLAHPGISRLLDGGVTEEGCPYLVLSYVDGLPLDEHCGQQRLELPERINLFRSVCQAVSFAHGQLVIHRDLKPANILVTATGFPVVLDFGLATLVKTSVSHALDSTATGHRLLTPEYASPEQVRGLRVTPASDVYALGLVLYELLTGVRPHQFMTWSMAEIVHVVCDLEPGPPSTARPAGSWPVSPHELRGGLDSVVMHAIAKEPANRYTHVAELDDDLRRYTEGRALPASPGEHTRRDRDSPPECR